MFKVFLLVMLALLPAFLGLVGFIYCFNFFADLLLGTDRGFWSTLLVSPICLVFGSVMFGTIWALIVGPLLRLWASLFSSSNWAEGTTVYFGKFDVGEKSDIIDVTPKSANSSRRSIE